MDGRCTQKTITLAYPKHHDFKPEDLLFFLESTAFTASWTAAGLNDEDDLESLQLCIMCDPYGDETIDGTGGLRKHHHRFEFAPEKHDVVAYYGYFEEYGIVYLNCLDEMAEGIDFTRPQREQIRTSLIQVKAEIERLKTIR